MIIKIRLNSDDTKIYKLVSWSTADFANSLSIKVQGEDLTAITQDFSEITKMEVFQDGNLVATYSDLDSFDEVSFLKNEYVEGEQIFSNAFRIHLTKTNIVQQVQRLDEQINPVIDVDAMTLDEAKAYKIKEIGADCRADIYAGEPVTLPDGTIKYYTYNDDDQRNLTNAAILGFVAKTMGFDLDYIPYHASQTMCELISTADVVTIYMTLQLRLTRMTTKCNMLNCMINEMTSKEDVLALSWQSELSLEYQEQYETIVYAANQIAQAMAEAMIGPVTPDETVEENQEG